MITLAIDTSAHLCAAALHDGATGAILAEHSEDIGRGHAERLMETIGQALGRAGLAYSDIARVAASVGPGSFTGVRVGLATARGMALGLGVPVVGVSALDALRAAAATADTDTPLLVALDARRGEAYAQFFGDVAGDLPDGPFVAPCEAIAAMVGGIRDLTLCGSGAPLLVEALGRDIEIRHRLAAAPIAEYARLGAAAPVPQTRPEPLYLRPPDAKPQAGFALARA